MLLGAASLSSLAQGYKDGIEYYKAGQYDNAITLLKRNIDNAETDKALAYYYLGSAYLATGNKAEAKKYFDLGVQANADCGYNYVGLGAIALLDKNENAARDYFKQAQNNAKKNTEVLVDIARAYYNADPVIFAKDIDKLIQKAHKDSKHKEPAIYVFEGDRKFKNKDYNGAATEYEQAITFDEDNPEGYVKYANTYFYVVPEYAINKLKELLQRNPTSALAQRELAEKFFMNDQWSEAAKQYGDYINNPNHFPEDKARYAVLLYSGGNYDQSLNTSREVLQQTPDNTMLQRLVFFNLDRLNRKDEALIEAEKYFSNPKNNTLFNAADFRTYGNLLYTVKKDSVGAREIFEKGVEKFPNDAQMLYSLSDWHFDKRDFPKSADYVNQYIEKSKSLKSTDYYNAAARDRFAAIIAYQKQDTVTAKQYADTGLKLMDKAMEGVQAPYQYYRRIGQLAVLANSQNPDARAAEAFEKEVELLNANPANADPTNPKNTIAEYREAYSVIYSYYNKLGDTAKADAAKELYNKFNDLGKANK